jgi:2-keto-4-pentenoate hydratase
MAMSSDASVDRFADLIIDSCLQQELRADLPAPGISTVAEAYAVQDQIFARRTEPGAAAAGWFVAATNASMRDQLGLKEPYAARWRPGRIVEAPVSPLGVGPLGAALELEVSFEMAEDLRPRSQPYSEREVLAAVRTVRPSVEIVITCFSDWMNQKPLNVIAEGGGDQWLVVGPAVEDWQALPLANIPVALTIDGREAAAGSTALVMDGPVSVLLWLANHAATRAGGLRKGQICNTGMCAPVHFTAPGEHARADFGQLGSITLDVAPAMLTAADTFDLKSLEEGQ